MLGARRRAILRTTTCLSLAGLAGTCLSIVALAGLAGCERDAPERARNVVLLVLDTTRYDALSTSGSERARTPYLDALAAEGIVFTEARSTAAWTVPSHGSLFTGLYPSNHGAHHENPRLDAEQTTLAELLSRTHQTAGFSENSFIQADTGYAQGFDDFDDTWRARANWSEPPDTIAKVRAWLSARDRDEPFFLFINLMTPHLPYDPPPRYADRFVPDGTPDGAVLPLRNLGERAAQRYMTGTLELGDGALALMRSLYLADVAYTDEQVGTIVDTLRADGTLDETLLIVVGDHGENIGDHQLMEHQFSLNETVLRVPMILRLPGTFPAGERNDAPVQLVDVLPTVVELAVARLEAPDTIDGQSLLGEGPPETRAVLAEFMRPVMQRRAYRDVDPDFDFDRFDRRLKSLQIGNLKLIASDDGEARLYDVATDPGETMDLARERPEELALLRQQLDAWLDGNWEPRQRGDLPDVDQDTVRELRSLGYIQ